MELILSCNALSKKIQYMNILSEISVNLYRGRNVLLLGVTGSGKSTLLKLFAGLLRPTRGEINYELSNKRKIKNQSIAYLSDECFLDDKIKISEAVRFYSKFYKDFDSMWAYDMFDRYFIDITSTVGSLSESTKQLVCFVLIAARKAEIYLLDEPLKSMNVSERNDMINQFFRRKPENSCVLFASKEKSDSDFKFDDVMILKNGVMFFYDSVENAKKEGII